MSSARWRVARIAVLCVVSAALVLVAVAWYLEPFEAVDGSTPTTRSQAARDDSN